MGMWQITIPEATTNLDNNPSFEKSVSSLAAANGAAIAQSSDEQAIGFYSAKVTPTAATDDGVYRAYTLTASTTYTFSFSVKAVDGIGYKAYFYDVTAAGQLGEAVSFVGDGTWRRYNITVTTSANTSYRVYIIKNGDASTGAFYLDAFQLETKGHATTYGDGDQPGWIWTAGAHTSTSARSGQSTAGGRVEDLGQDKYPKIRHALGVGAAPVEIIDTLPAQSDGGDYQDTLIRPRQFQLIGYAEGKGNGIDGRIDYHRKRRNLLQAFNPHGVTPKQPRNLRYRVDGNSVMIRADYETGLQRQKTPDAFAKEGFSLGLKAQDPFFRAVMGVANSDNGANGIDGQGASVLTAQSTVTDADYILQKGITGEWAAMGTGLSLPIPGLPDGEITTMAIGIDGFFYIGGQFSSVGGVANTAGIAKWDGTTWSALGTGASGGNVQSIVMDSSGDFFVGGNFTSMGGVANTAGIAKWDGTTWSALSTGVDNNGVYALAIDSSDNLFAGGNFTLMSGVANTVRIAKWDGSNWTPLGTGVNDIIYDLAFDSSDNLFIGGYFTLAGGVADTNKIAKWDGSNWTPLGTGANNTVHALAIDSSDNLFAGGTFTLMSGVADTVRIAKWNGSAWSALGTGVDDGGVWSIVIDKGDDLYLGGNFTLIGGDSFAGIAKWNGSTFSQLGSGVDAIIFAMTISYDGQLYIGGEFSSAGGVSDTDYFARWTGVAWRTIALSTKAILQATDGKIYMGGGFINAGGVANADRIAYYDPETITFIALSTGANGIVNAIAEAPNGDIYIGGSFSLVGGVADTVGVAYWDVSASVWLPLDTGINGTVLSLAFSPDGDLYIGGLFEDAGGVADTQNLAIWDGSAFNALSDEPDGAVNALLFDNAGTLWLAGTFEDIGATNVDYIASYNTSTDTFSALETGTNGFVNDLALGPNGNIYLVGAFTQAGSIAGVNYVARWNGTQFSGFGSGFNNVAFTVGVDGDGKIYVGGAFTTAGGGELPDKVAVWTGSTWTSVDVDLPGTATVEAILVTNVSIFLGFDTEGSATANGVTSLTYNGDAYGYPVVTVNGPGRLYEITNITTGQSIYFDLDLEDGEVLTVDLTPGNKTVVSTFRGAIPNVVLEGSDLETFYLNPGANSMSILLDDAGGSAYMLWDEVFQSFDSVIYLPIVSG